jgi:hypothetical protein
MARLPVRVGTISTDRLRFHARLMNPFFLEVREVLVDRRERREAEAPADFFEAGRIAVLADELGEVVENLALAFGQWQHLSCSLRATLRKAKAKVKIRTSRHRAGHV